MDEAQAVNRAADPEQEGRGGTPTPVTVPVELVEAIARIQRLRDAEQELLDLDETLDEGETIGAVRAYDAALDILQLLAHGVTPEQGAPEVSA